MSNPKYNNSNSLASLNFFRIASAVPEVRLADPEANCQNIILMMNELAEKGASLALFPELCITGYSCGDLFRQRNLLEQAEKTLDTIAKHTAICGLATVVGLPVLHNGALYNCAAFCKDGKVKALITKSYLPSHNEFYESRWFTPGTELHDATYRIGNEEIPFGINILMKSNVATIGIEICEDLWMPNPPSTQLSLAGANILLNLSASNEVIGKHDYLESLILQQSSRCMCAYVYSSAGQGESSTDLVFAGNAMVSENGKMLKKSKRFATCPFYVIADIDLDLINNERQNSSFNQQSVKNLSGFRIVNVDFETVPVKFGDSERYFNPMPFVPSDKSSRQERAEEIISIQSAGLEQRLKHIGGKSLVVGISGGLDSTLALLIAVRAFDNLGLDRKGITGITMPGFGTTGRTHTNATTIMERLGVTIKEIPIAASVEQHFHDIGHDKNIKDVTYENCQARERTQILMDYANKTGGIVLGTGDLSELALGWCTYNGDHMSMYGVNASIPKTLVRHLVEWFADSTDDLSLREALLDICATPISPELIPADENGEIAQKTEDLVGPYELHDFFLYNLLRYGFSPVKIFNMACKAFKGVYDETTILHWLKTFYRRFFNQQFKRSCMPDGPKVGSICLSPRGDWRMPSDAKSSLWLRELEEISCGIN